MSKECRVSQIIEPTMVLEGAGVRLKRSIASRALDYLDPFLLFDHFGSHHPDDYLPGFPMHPHRGIETVTYMLAGSVDHKDSLGNEDTIHPGEVQWMTAGGGIMHEEMPNGDAQDHMEGFQLWVNLPASRKMCAPRYQGFRAEEIPSVSIDPGVRVRVIAGEYGGVSGPVRGIDADPTYLDAVIDKEQTFTAHVKTGYTTFVYFYSGGADHCGTPIAGTRLVVLENPEEVRIKAGVLGARLLLVSGKPLNEPIVRHGPIVMNTEEEIRQAFADLRDGTFVKKPKTEN